MKTGEYTVRVTALFVEHDAATPFLVQPCHCMKNTGLFAEA